MTDTLFAPFLSTISTSEGNYSWVIEIIAIVVFVLFFNFFAKRLLKRLHVSYEKQNNIWMDGFVKALYLPLSYYVWFFALISLSNIAFSKISACLLPVSMQMILSIGAILAAAWFLMRWKKNIVQNLGLRSKSSEISIDQGKIDAINKIATLAIIFFTIIALLEATNSNVATLIAFSGIGGLALAFASQEIIANFFGGFMIYLNRSFVVGDWILLTEKNIEGTVEEIGGYLTRIRSSDKRPMYVPNSMFTKLAVINPSRMSHRQIKETIGLRLEDLPKSSLIIADIKKMLDDQPDIDHNLPVIANLVSFSPYSLNIDIVLFSPITDTAGHKKMKQEILLNIGGIILKHNAKLASWALSEDQPPIK